MEKRRIGREMAAVLCLTVFPLLVNSYVAIAEPNFPLSRFSNLSEIGYTISVIAPLLYIMWTSPEGLKHFGIRKPRWSDLAWPVLIVFVLFLAMSFLDGLLRGSSLELVETEATKWIFNDMENQASISRPLLVFTLFLSALMEELAMRAYLVTRLKGLVRDGYISVVVAAVPFALYHAYQGASGVLGIYLMGILFGLFFLRLRSVWPLALAHGLYNTILVLGNSAGG